MPNSNALRDNSPRTSNINRKKWGVSREGGRKEALSKKYNKLPALETSVGESGVVTHTCNPSTV